jgi:hypothetical protein
MSELKTIAELMSETEVYKRFPSIFADKELREARQAGLIEWYNLRKGPHYSENQLIAYVQTKLRKLGQNRPLWPEPHTETPQPSSEDAALISRALEGGPARAPKAEGLKRGRPRKE